MVKSIGEAVSGVDAGVLIVEPKGAIREEEKQLLEQFRRQKLPAVLVINKIDTLEDKAALLLCMDRWKDAYAFDAILPVSALTGDGVEELIAQLGATPSTAPTFSRTTR